jgi:AcrR family transcriptional regulator
MKEVDMSRSLPSTTVSGLRAARTRDIEERIVAAAHRLFVERGYARTALTDVADAAGVAHRTVYVRFGTKAALLNRTIDVALAGDVLPVPVGEREPFRQAMSAPALEDRITALAVGIADLFERSADILAVGFEASRQVGEIGTAAEAGRQATLEQARAFWRQAQLDGLLPPDVNLTWIAEASGLLIQPETYLLGRSLLGWTPSAYRRWLVDTLERVVRSGRKLP